ncbi:protein SODIUM POTASSIUM ROOT DEFECTIVE 3-like [Miscanthus floridulus]|uniref:protein SODIUM POTASSIUM ROOT DEFECTIVE 3-like n=1 Tax=Miscanthus floridulus TaxID=154761 RepID=UPI003459B30D
MASMLRWKNRYVNERLQGLSGLSCSSAASTSVVASTGRAIDRHSPHLRDPHRRLPPSLPKPPRPSSSPFSSTIDSSSSRKQQQQLYHYDDDGKDRSKKKSPAAVAGRGSSSTSSSEHRKNKKKAVQLQQVSPASSSRFLLNSSRLMMQSDDEITVVDSLPPLPSPRPYFIDDAGDDIDIFPPSHGGAVLPAVPSSPQLVAPPVDLFAEPSASGAGSSSSSSEIGGSHVVAGDNTVMVRSCSTRTGQHQVVVLRVSLHCKGCAGKVKKHISKMEGVTSFDIDIATKKVTVVGDVTPLGVLNSISKVKSAQFWPDSRSYFSTPPRASASF